MRSNATSIAWINQPPRKSKRGEGENDREQYAPGPASGAQVLCKDGEKWGLVLVRELRHSPDKVWQALTDPAQLREWAGQPIGRIVGPDAMKFDGWQRLNAEYAQQFGTA